MRAHSVGNPRLTSTKWAVFRLVLGWLQMVGAAAAFMLVLQSGMSRPAIVVVVVTALLTVISLVLFRAR